MSWARTRRWTSSRHRCGRRCTVGTRCTSDPYHGHYYSYVHNAVVDEPDSNPAWDVKAQETSTDC
jgi:hypothetical protein